MAIDQPIRYYKLDKITTVDELVKYLKKNGEGNINIESIEEVPKFHLFVVSKHEIVLPIETGIQIRDGNYLLKIKDKWFIAEEEYYFFIDGKDNVVNITSENIINFIVSDQKIYIDPLESYLEK
jgi:hypothetical protein